VDTAELMAVGPVEKSVALLPDRTQPPVRLLELKALVAGWRGAGTLVLVTHGFTISPLLRTYLEQAETLVLKPGGGSGAGREHRGEDTHTSLTGELSTCGLSAVGAPYPLAAELGFSSPLSYSS
jgi:hypothetical protein